MPLSQRITIRLSPDLATRLAARTGPHGKVTDIIRHALEAYLRDAPATRQPAPKRLTATADTTAVLTAITTRLTQIEQRLEALEAAATHASQWEPPALRRRKLTPRQIRALRDKHLRGVSIPALLEEYGISKASLFRYLQSHKRAATRQGHSPQAPASGSS